MNGSLLVGRWRVLVRLSIIEGVGISYLELYEFNTLSDEAGEVQDEWVSIAHNSCTPNNITKVLQLQVPQQE